MKKPLLFITLILIITTASAQKVYFAYFQSEDQTPFYIKLKDKVYSSASAGYLTISNLRDTTYTFLIGFASNAVAEKRFNITINGSDLGINLKNLPDGPQVFDMQNVALIKAIDEQASTVVYETKTDRFSAVLSKAADDPTLLQKPVIKQEKVKAEEPPVTEIKEVLAATETSTKSETAITIEQTDVPKVEIAIVENNKTAEVTEASEKSKNVVPEQELAYQKSQVARYSETSTTEGFGIVYFDKIGSSADTIRLLIPNPKVMLAPKEVPRSDESFFLEIKTPPAAERPKEVQPVIEEKTSPEKAEGLKKVENKSSKSSDENSVAISNASCSNVATEKEFFKVRRNMAAKESDEAMVDEGRKAFRKQCFTVDQIRHLSSLFLTSAGKYQFFDAAYEYAADKANFNSLQSEIRDPYYLKRFKALVGE